MIWDQIDFVYHNTEISSILKQVQGVSNVDWDK
jgi:hypothetical protein